MHTCSEKVYATEQSTAANRPDSQNNCSMCSVHHSVEPHYHSLQFVTPVIKFVDDLLVEILPAGAHSVIEIAQAGNRSAINTCCAGELLIYREINRVQTSSPGCWSHTDGSINFHETFFFVCERHSTCKRCV